jgi:hypothetical protein
MLYTDYGGKSDGICTLGIPGVGAGVRLCYSTTDPLSLVLCLMITCTHAISFDISVSSRMCKIRCKIDEHT